MDLLPNSSLKISSGRKTLLQSRSWSYLYLYHTTLGSRISTKAPTRSYTSSEAWLSSATTTTTHMCTKQFKMEKTACSDGSVSMTLKLGLLRKAGTKLSKSAWNAQPTPLWLSTSKEIKERKMILLSLLTNNCFAAGREMPSRLMKISTVNITSKSKSESCRRLKHAWLVLATMVQ